MRETVSGREPSAKVELSSGTLQPPPQPLQPSAWPHRGPQPRVDCSGSMLYSEFYENLPSFLLGKRVLRLFRSWKASGPWPSIQSLDLTSPVADLTLGWTALCCAHSGTAVHVHALGLGTTMTVEALSCHTQAQQIPV